MARKTETSGPSVSAQEALEFHAMGRPGKVFYEVKPWPVYEPQDMPPTNGDQK